MSHKHYKNQLPFFLYDELTEEEKRDLENHLKGCGECQGELEQLRKLHTAIAQHRRVTMSHQMLADARRRLRVALSEKLSRPPLWERLIEPIYKVMVK
jgi:anti-sigma factor RsiW